jgi:molecular chaperone GrpE
VTDNGIKIHKEGENTEEGSINEQAVQEQEVLPSDDVTHVTLVSDAIDEVQEEAIETVGGEVSEEEALGEQVPSEEDEEDELTRLTKQLQAKEREAKEHYEARLRVQAEFENFKKRQEKELTNFRKYAHENIIHEVLPVVDDFERAIAAAEQTHNLEDFLKGIELIFQKFLGVLQKKGVTEIEVEKGQPFNPEIHEAVTQIETDDVEEGSIAQVFQKGYYLHDRVIRAPKVGVATKREG